MQEKSNLKSGALFQLSSVITTILLVNVSGTTSHVAHLVWKPAGTPQAAAPHRYLPWKVKKMYNQQQDSLLQTFIINVLSNLHYHCYYIDIGFGQSIIP